MTKPPDEVFDVLNSLSKRQLVNIRHPTQDEIWFHFDQVRESREVRLVFNWEAPNTKVQTKGPGDSEWADIHSTFRD